MLVLSRKKRQRIHIGDGIIIEVLDIRGNKVRIGVTAPKEVRIRNLENDKEILEDGSDKSGK